MGLVEDGCIRWGGYRQREGIVLGVKFGRPIVTSGAFATRLFSNYFEDLFFGILRGKQTWKSHGTDSYSAPQNCPKTVPWPILL